MSDFASAEIHRLEEENASLKGSIRVVEETSARLAAALDRASRGRDFRRRQVRALKTENARLRKEYQDSDQDNMRLQQHLDAERGQSNARLQKLQRSEKENSRLRSVVESIATRCDVCGGTGYVVKASGKVGQPLNRERIPCPACSDLREALQPKGSVG